MEIPKHIDGHTVDITPLLEETGLGTTPVSIIETDGMYPYKTKIEDNWAYYTAVGMKRLREMLQKENRTPETIGIVGICSGVEAIAIARIFESAVKKIIVTDIDEGILQGTMYNLQHTVSNKDLEIVPVVGSFCEPIESLGEKVEFVHGNIPNLPASGSEDLTKGAEKGTFLMVGTYAGYNPPEKFLGWALGAQYAYLQSAKPILVSGGSVITELGGRIPLEVIQDLFETCGYRLEEIVVGFKEQTEALIDFEGYHRLEKQYGTSFEFYRYDEAKGLLESRGIANPTHAIQGIEIKSMLAPYKVSAGEALALHHQGVAVGHTVHLFRGIK